MENIKSEWELDQIGYEKNQNEKENEKKGRERDIRKFTF